MSKNKYNRYTWDLDNYDDKDLLSSTENIRNQITNLDTRVSTNQSNINTINGNVTNLDTRVSTNQSNITNLNNKLWLTVTFKVKDENDNIKTLEFTDWILQEIN